MSDKEAAKELGITDAGRDERLALAFTIANAISKITYLDREGRTSWKLPEFAELLHEDGWRRKVDSLREAADALRERVKGLREHNGHSTAGPHSEDFFKGIEYAADLLISGTIE